MAGNTSKRRVLLDEAPLIVLPTLARVIGLNQAIFVQQVHYWLTITAEKGNNLRDGHMWTYCTLNGWSEQFPFWHRNTIRNIIHSLQEQGILIIGVYNRNTFDRTRWYRLNYERLRELLSPYANSCHMDMPNHSTSICTEISTSICREIGTPIPKTSSDTSSDTSLKEDKPARAGKKRAPYLSDRPKEDDLAYYDAVVVRLGE